MSVRPEICGLNNSQGMFSSIESFCLGASREFVKMIVRPEACRMLFVCLWSILIVCYFAQIASIVVFEEFIVKNSTNSNIENVGILSQCTYSRGFWNCKMSSLSVMFSWDLFQSAPPVILLLSLLLATFALAVMFLACFIKFTVVVITCGVLVGMSGMFLTILVLILPLTLGGVSLSACTLSRFTISDCHLGWTYLLAIMTCVDSVKILVLSFILAMTYGKRTHNNAPWDKSFAMTPLKKSRDFNESTLPASINFSGDMHLDPY